MASVTAAALYDSGTRDQSSLPSFIGSSGLAVTPSIGSSSQLYSGIFPKKIVKIRPRIEGGASPAVERAALSFRAEGDGGQGENRTTHSPLFRSAPSGLPTRRFVASLSALSPDIGDVSAGEQSPSNLPGAVPHGNGKLPRRRLYGLLGAQG